MITRKRFPHRVREIENAWIPLSDGCRLAARIWLPASAHRHPVPAVLEYLPYRKRDFMRVRDEPMHRWYAGHGYAAVRVDLRGSGDSDGLLLDEYLPREQEDAVEVICWIAGQPWCTGRVGMLGVSWGGFNSLQVAALDPPELGAIITLCSTDDRYTDDVHYMGGCLLNDNLIWGSVMFTLNALPPDPEIAGERWRAVWKRRLEHAVLFPEVWMRHPTRDEYWRQGSVCEDYSRIRCPVYVVGGWMDGYSNAVPRLLAGLTSPRKGLVGPWAHGFPHDAPPGPNIGFLQESLRWWDRWLKDRDDGIMDEPMYRVWMQESVPPRPYYPSRPGRWVAEDTWPSPRLETRVLHLRASFALSDGPEESDVGLECRAPQSTGLAAGEWCGYGSEGEAPIDQRQDDGKSLCFDSAPLAAPLEILGAPVLEIDVAADRPRAFIAVRLNDVSPGGASTRVTYALLNLTHLEGHDRPRRLEPGRYYRVRLPLNDVAHRFHAGHVLRIAVSSAYWPIAWPSPRPVSLSIGAAGSRLLLPVRPPRAADADLRDFAAPETAAVPDYTPLRAAALVRAVERDLLDNRITYTVLSDGGDFEGAAVVRVHDIDLELGHTISRKFVIEDDDPSSALAEVSQTALLRRRDWSVHVATRMRLTATEESFRLEAELRALEGGECIHERRWDTRIEREYL